MKNRFLHFLKDKFKGSITRSRSFLSLSREEIDFYTAKPVACILSSDLSVAIIFAQKSLVNENTVLLGCYKCTLNGIKAKAIFAELHSVAEILQISLRRRGNNEIIFDYDEVTTVVPISGLAFIKPNILLNIFNWINNYKKNFRYLRPLVFVLLRLKKKIITNKKKQLNNICGVQPFPSERGWPNSENRYHFNNFMNEISYESLAESHIDGIAISCFIEGEYQSKKLIDKKIAAISQNSKSKDFENFQKAFGGLEIRDISPSDSVLHYLHENRSISDDFKTLGKLFLLKRFINNSKYSELWNLIDNSILLSSAEKQFIDAHMCLIFGLATERKNPAQRPKILFDNLNRMRAILQDGGKKNPLHFISFVSLTELSSNAFHASEAGAILDDNISWIAKTINSNFVKRKSWAGAIAYPIGVIELLKCRPETASKYFEQSKQWAFFSKLIQSHVYSGKLRIAQKLCYDFLSKSKSLDQNKVILSKLVSIDGMLNINQKDFIEYNCTLSGSRVVAPVHIETNDKIQKLITQNVFVSDHDFVLTLKLKFIKGYKRKIYSICRLDDHGFELVSTQDGSVTLVIHNHLGDNVVFTSKKCLKAGENLITIDRNGTVVSFHINGTIHKANLSSNFVLLGGELVLNELCNRNIKLTHFKLKIFEYPKPIATPKEVVIYSSWYGDSFSDLFLNSLIVSLCRSDGLPKLKNDFKITLNIYTSYEQLSKLEGVKLKLLTIFDEVNIDSKYLGFEACSPREYLHESFIHCLEECIEKNAIFLFAPPDHIFGAGLYNLVKNLKHDQYVVCGHPRISYEKYHSSNKGDPLIFGHDKAYISNREMVSLSVEKFGHSVATYGLNHQIFDAGNSEPSTWWKGRLEKNEYIVNFKEPPPILISPNRDFLSAMVSKGNLSSFERVDHDIVEWAWKNNRLKLITDSEEFFWVEFCRDSRNHPTIMNDYWPKGASAIFETDLIWRK